MKHRLLFFIPILLCATISNAQKLETKLQYILDSVYKTNQDAVGIMVHVELPNKKVSWTSASGLSNKDSLGMINENQPVLIASNTKTYVSVAILKLVENGMLELNQSIKKLLNRKTRRLFIKGGYNLSEITVRHLLSHTSGITDYVDDDYFSFVDDHPNHKWTRNEQIRLAIKKANPKETGKTFSYGDINYLLLTEILELETGEPFYTAIRNLLDFKKHNLSHTWFVNLEDTPSNTLPLVHQYSDKYNWDSYNLDPSWDLYGGGGLASTTKDIALFFQLLFNGEIIKNQEVLSQIYTYVIPREESTNYCLGLYHFPSFFGYEAYYHGGFWGTDVIYLPELNGTISVFTLVKEKRNLNAQISNEIIKILTQ